MLGTSVFAGLAWLLQAATFAGNPPQIRPTPTVRAAEACRASLTELGRAATFSGTAIFEAVTDATGGVVDVTPLRVPDLFDKVVEVAEFRSCVGRWRFSGPGKSVVAFSAGTTGEALKAWSISVTSGDSTFLLVLPRGLPR